MMCELEERMKRLDERVVAARLDLEEIDKVLSVRIRGVNETLAALQKKLVKLEELHERMDADVVRGRKGVRA